MLDTFCAVEGAGGWDWASSFLGEEDSEVVVLG